jgi:hypothetical protein
MNRGTSATLQRSAALWIHGRCRTRTAGVGGRRRSPVGRRDRELPQARVVRSPHRPRRPHCARPGTRSRSRGRHPRHRPTRPRRHRGVPTTPSLLRRLRHHVDRPRHRGGHHRRTLRRRRRLRHETVQSPRASGPGPCGTSTTAPDTRSWPGSRPRAEPTPPVRRSPDQRRRQGSRPRRRTDHVDPYGIRCSRRLVVTPWRGD